MPVIERFEETTTGPSRPPRYMPQLDAVRTFAVFAVMIHHFWHEATFGIPLGFIGVQLFFVLSGFLITGILLPARESVQAGRLPAATTFRRFFIRRFLRIFPLFYVTLAVLWIVGVEEVRDNLPWHVTYLSNIHFARTGEYPLYIAHLWSLAVEEQFYLIWPFIIVLTPRRFLLATLVSVVAIGPAYRLIGSLLNVDWMWTFTPLTANVDSLALGGILAYGWATDSGSTTSLRARLSRTGAWVGIPLAAGLTVVTMKDMSLGILHTTFEHTAWALFFVWVIDGAARGFGGIAGRTLELRPLTYLGRISYGLYVFHPLVAGLAYWLFEQVGRPYQGHPGVLFGPLVIATIALAALSWHLYERPLNDLKRRFDDPPSPSRAIA
jgi:peptidoglycan/LPS O-acetylase OafA/YrhL